MLKEAGVTDAVVMDIIGHESKAISRNYTHISESSKEEAMAKLPDITKKIFNRKEKAGWRCHHALTPPGELAARVLACRW